MNKCGFLICIILLVIQNKLNATQTPLSEEAFFHRCYSLITGSFAPLNHISILDIKAKKTTGLDACLAVLNKANFNQEGMLPNVADKEAVSIQKTFYNFHRSWFMEKDTSNTPGLYTAEPDNYIDPTEPALFLSHALFQPGVSYSTIVKANYSLRGIRSTNGNTPTSYRYGTNSNNDPLFTPINFLKGGIHRGNLIGISNWGQAENSTWYNPSGGSLTSAVFSYGRGTQSPKRSYGNSGIIGLSSYIWMNTGYSGAGDSDNLQGSEGSVNVANGSIRMPRRWARNIMNDLLCRELPVLRRADVGTIVAEYNASFGNSATQLPFRTNSVCMACHDTIDPMSATLRNFSFYRADIGETRNAWIYEATVSSPADPKKLHMTHRESAFRTRPPNGHLRFRSYDGTLVEVPIVATTSNTSGLSGLGTALSETNDLYVCAAQRYFEFFTGIKANIGDIGDPNNPIPAKDLAYRNKVINLGLSLKEHRNLKELIKQIISSDTFRKTSMRDVAQ